MEKAKLTDEQQGQKHVASAMHSVSLINTLLAKDVKTQDDLNTIKRNVEHLEIVQTYETVIAHGGDLSALQAAVVAGKAALA